MMSAVSCLRGCGPRLVQYTTMVRHGEAPVDDAQEQSDLSSRMGID